jgi:hypothetical protein
MYIKFAGNFFMWAKSINDSRNLACHFGDSPTDIRWNQDSFLITNSFHVYNGEGRDIQNHKLRMTQHGVNIIWNLKFSFEIVLFYIFKNLIRDFRFSQRWLRVWPSGLSRRLVRRHPDISVGRMVTIFRVGDGGDMFFRSAGASTNYTPQ